MFGQIASILVKNFRTQSQKLVQVDVEALCAGDVIRENGFTMTVQGIEPSVAFQGKNRVQFSDGTFSIMTPGETVSRFENIR